jgi:hypothetical protein
VKHLPRVTDTDTESRHVSFCRSGRDAGSPCAPLALALLALGLACPRDAWAQLPPLAEAATQYVPASHVSEGGGLRAQISSYDAQINVPTVLGKNTFFISGLQYHVDSVSYSREPPGFTPLNALHGIDVTLLLAQRVSDKLTLSFRAWPGVAGDLEALDSGLLHVGALAMLTWSPQKTFTLGGGALASYAFGQALPLPMLYLDWTPRQSFRVEASLPFFASAIFRHAGRLELGALADVAGNEYAIRKREIRERYPCVAGSDDPNTAGDEARAAPERCADHLAYSVISAGAVARVRLFSSLWLGTFFGRTLFRRYDVKNADGVSVPGGQAEIDNQWLLRLSLTFRVPLPDSPEPAARAR